MILQQETSTQEQEAIAVSVALEGTDEQLTVQEQSETPVDYTKPLSLALLAVVTKEFDAFVQDPKGGWDLTYPIFYKTLLGIVTEICTEMNVAIPGLFIQYAGTNARQALVKHMLDGSKQLHIGTEFIRTQLLDSSPEDALLRHRAFRWAIAHEIGHIGDPVMRWWSSPRVWAVRVLSQKVAGMLIFAGIFDLIFAQTPMLHYFSGGKAFLFITAGLTVKAVHKLVETSMHRYFEYTADRLSFNTADHFTTAEPHYALVLMNAAIAQEVVRQEQEAKNALIAVSKESLILRIVLPLQLIVLVCKQWYARFNLSLLHPSFENRIAAIKKQLAFVHN